MNNKKIFVLDTNILIHDPAAAYSFEEHDVKIPMTVLEELDRLKDRKGNKSHDARIAIKSIEKVFTDSTPEEIVSGVELVAPDGKKRGELSIFNDIELQHKDDSVRKVYGLGGFYGGPDNSIIESAIFLQNEYKDRDVVLVTKDINMRLKAKSMKLKFVEDYKSDQVVDDIKFLAKGYEKFEGNFWDKVKECVSTDGGSYENTGAKCVHKLDKKVFDNPYANQYIIDDTNEFAGRIMKVDEKTVDLLDKGYNALMNKKAWGISPKNIQQGMAMDALLDPEIDMVTLTGPAGSGKTLLCLAAALELVIEKGMYDKIIVTRSTPEIAESIGFLPGTEEEKMAPWLAAISDSLEVLHKNDHDKAGSIDYIVQKANIQFKSLNFMRGRSIQNAIVILDESQNLTPSQVKTMITRMAENTRLFNLGNLSQIDSNYVSASTSALSTVVEKFKHFEGSAVVNLLGGERSKLSAFAEENL